MSVVVTCATERPARVVTWHASRVAHPVHRAPHGVLERPCRPASLRSKNRMPSLHLDRRAGEAVRVGAAPRSETGSRACRRARRNGTARARAGSTSLDRGHGLRVREVERRLPERSPIRSIERSSSSAASAAACGRASGANACASRRSTRPVDARVAQRRPRERPAAGGKLDGRSSTKSVAEVERGGNLVPHEDRQRDLGEVGGAVVEGHHDRRFWRGSGDRPATGASSSRAMPSATHRPAATAAICSSKRPGSRSISSAEPPPTRW